MFHVKLFYEKDYYTEGCEKYLNEPQLPILACLQLILNYK